MKRYLLLIILALFCISESTAQKLGDIEFEMIKIDSLKRVVRENTGLELFYKMENGDDTLSHTLQVSKENFLEELHSYFSRLEYSLTRIGNALFLLKGAGIMTELPDNYFQSKVIQDSASQYLKALSTTDKTALLENKIYQIGDLNHPSSKERVILSGYVKDIESGEALSSVSIILDKPHTVVNSDMFGFYRILLPTGRVDLSIKGFGLNDTKLMLEIFGDGEMDIAMKEKVYPLKGVVLTAESTQKMRSTQIGLERVRIGRIKHVPSAFGESDVMKIVLTLPGVKSVGESSGGFNVRGGATDQNLILFNEGTIYNPSHLFGLFSAFNPDIVSDIELYKSTIPAKYGGRISSVLEINSRTGNNNKIVGSAGIGLLTSKFHIEGPIKKDKSNFIAAMRTTYSNWILGLLPAESGYRDGKASFYDFTGGVSHKFNNKNTLYLYGYYSGDNFKFSADTSYNYQNMNYSVKWRNILNDEHNMVMSFGFDHYSYGTEERGNPVNSFKLNFDINQLYFKTNFNWLIDENHSANYGISATYYNLLPGILTPSSPESLMTSRHLGSENAFDIALYANDNWDISDRLSIDLGIRYSLYSQIGPKTYYRYASEEREESNIIDSVKVGKGGLVKPYHAPEVRISARYSINDDFSLKAGFNSMRQNIHMLSNTSTASPTDIWRLSDANIVPQRGWQAAFGLYRNAIRSKVELSLEGYYKKMYDYLDYKSGAVLNMNEFIERDVIKTEGKAYGIELLAKKPLGKLNGWFAYTYSKTLLRESGDKELYNINNGNWYPAAYDKPHDLKIVSNYKFTQRYSISLNVDYATGRPVTIPISKYYYGDGYRLFYSDRNAYRIPHYFRLDIAFNIEPSHNLTLLTHSTITFGVYNLTGRKNAFSVYYDTHDGTKIQGYKLSIFGSPIPYISYNIKF